MKSNDRISRLDNHGHPVRHLDGADDTSHTRATTMNGKGSKQRPRQISQEQLDTNWSTTFQAKPACGTCKLWDGSSYHQYGDCQRPGPVKITKHRSEKCGEWEKR